MSGVKTALKQTRMQALAGEREREKEEMTCTQEREPACARSLAYIIFCEINNKCFLA